MTTSTATQTETKTQLKPVSMWRVVFHNDDFTPMDFVIAVLMRLYGKNFEEAEFIAQSIHRAGRGVAGVYTKEIALQKAADTIRTAQANGHPLLATAEEA
jgi:ATP-dependent Clp protease adaptor protein ClpS